MMNFNEIDMFTKVFDAIFEYVGLKHKFMCEVPSSTLNASEEVNTLVGISGDMEGNIKPHTLLKEMENAGFADVSYRVSRPFVGIAMGWKRE